MVQRDSLYVYTIHLPIRGSALFQKFTCSYSIVGREVAVFRVGESEAVRYIHKQPVEIPQLV